MNVRLARALVWATIAAAVVAGCGSSSPKSSATTAPAAATDTTPTTAASDTTPKTVPIPKACDLITKQQADSAIGLTLDAPVTGGASDSPACTLTAPPTGPIGQVEVYAGPGANKYYEVDQNIGHTFEAVPGLGDEAHLEPGAVFFRKGANWVAIRITSIDDSDAQIRAGVLALAQAAAAKLPS
jgi:hypothetical protein